MTALEVQFPPTSDHSSLPPGLISLKEMVNDNWRREGIVSFGGGAVIREDGTIGKGKGVPNVPFMPFSLNGRGANLLLQVYSEFRLCE